MAFFLHTKFRSAIKVYFYFLLVAFFSCTPEDPINTITVEASREDQEISDSSDFKVGSISFDELTRAIENTSNYQELANQFDVYSKSESGKSNGGKKTYILDTNYINKVESGDNISYTFRVKNSKDTQNVVVTQKGERLDIKLYTYHFNNGIEIDDKGIEFGEVEVEQLSKDQIKSGLASNGNCYYTNIGFPFPCNGVLGNGQPADHYPGDSCSADQRPGYIWVNMQVCLPGSPGQASIIMPRECTALQCAPIEGTGGGGGGGTGTGGGGFGDGTSPIIDDDGNSLWEIYLNSSVDYLDNLMNLNYAQEYYLKSHSTNLDEFMSYLYINGNSNEARAATKITIDALRYGKLNGPYNSQYYSTINSHVSANLTDPVTQARWAAHFSMQCAILKLEHPQWSDMRVFWEASKEMVHLVLDIGGLVPVIGEVCDLTNGLIYTIEGDGVNATLSFSAAIPVAGWFATGAKFAKRTIQLSNNSKTSLKWIVKANDLIAFGDRSQLRRVLKLDVGDPKQAHHLISWSKRNHQAIQKAAKSKNAFHMNEALNGIAVASWRNQPNHNLYDNRVQQLLDQIPANLSPEQTYNQVLSALNTVRNAVQNNPTKHLNDIVF